jgi:Fe-Mn family superoxide dismutase
MELGDDIKREIRKSLGLPERSATPPRALAEAYVVEPKSYSLKTDFLSDTAKKARIEDFVSHTKALNEVSARLDTASRDDADQYSSEFRSLKIDESRCINESFLKSRHFDNIDDPKSQIAMDTLTFMRLERDFGTFDTWQKDFIACGMSARSGYVVTAYNILMKRFMNLVIDGGDCNIPVGSFPVIVLDVSEGAYYRDYVGDRKTYIIAMMKELNWEVIEERVKKADRLAKVMA